MKKKLLLALITLCSINANAEYGSPFGADFRGINYTSFKDSNLPDNIKNNALASQEEMKKNGFVNKENQYVDFLLNTLQKKYIQEIKSYKNDPNPLDTHLKENFNEIKLAISYKPVTFIPKNNIIGFAAVNTYSQAKNNEGWEGVIEFFSYDGIGTCAYEYDKIAGVLLTKEFINNDINNRPSHHLVEGTHKTGFLYSLYWYKDTYSNSLRCANMKFDKDIMTKMIEMAKKIDKQ